MWRIEFEEQPLANQPVAVVDTETTGLSPAFGHRVVEVAVLRLEGMREVGHFSQLVHPGRAMDPAATRVNGITDEDLVGAPPFVDVLPALHAYLEDALIVAHNAAFDAGFLGMEYHLARLLHPGRESLPASLDNPWLCTMLLARRFFYFSRNSLGTIAQEMGVRTSRAHRAMNDVHTTAAILRRMVVELGRMGFYTAGDLLHAQGGAIYVPPPATLQCAPSIDEALRNKTYLHIRYQSSGGETERLILPLYLTEQNGQTYLVAHCTLRQAQRTFRLDRLQIISVD